MMGLSINARHRGLGFSDSPPEGAGRENVEGVHHAKRPLFPGGKWLFYLNK